MAGVVAPRDHSGTPGHRPPPPEGFHADGTFIPYPLESPQTGDWVCQQTAAEGLPALARMLGLA
jgi:hypothetical protein